MRCYGYVYTLVIAGVDSDGATWMLFYLFVFLLSPSSDRSADCNKKSSNQAIPMFWLATRVLGINIPLGILKLDGDFQPVLLPQPAQVVCTI